MGPARKYFWISLGWWHFSLGWRWCDMQRLDYFSVGAGYSGHEL